MRVFPVFGQLCPPGPCRYSRDQIFFFQELLWRFAVDGEEKVTGGRSEMSFQVARVAENFPTALITCLASPINFCIPKCFPGPFFMPQFFGKGRKSHRRCAPAAPKHVLCAG